MRTALLLALTATGCVRVPLPPPPAWTTGFWFWDGSDAQVTSQVTPLDVIYSQAGTITAARGVSVRLPPTLPQARQYWLVFRSDSPSLPSATSLAALHAGIQQLKSSRSDLTIAGIQLDIDSPTASLPQYAAFLREVRHGLDPSLKLSITALLDWFRPNTAIGDVIEAVDEFVPQFYDLHRTDLAIAAPIDAARWRTAFNRFRKPYRIGISTFGRARSGLAAVPDLPLLSVATNPDFHQTATTTPAGEIQLLYRALRNTTVPMGGTLAFTLATPASIRAAFDQAKLFGGSCAGVLFFRWPARNETLSAQPDEVLHAAGMLAKPPQPAELRTRDGHCSANHCTDLFLATNRPPLPDPLQYTIAASTGFRYFVPAEKAPVRASGTSNLIISLPPYCGRTRLYLGRVISTNQTTFTLVPNE